LAFSNAAPIWLKASVSEVAANTVTVPDSFADDEVPDELLGAEVVVDELHAASTRAAMTAHTAARNVTGLPAADRR
jgi:hypothetical protein